MEIREGKIYASQRLCLTADNPQRLVAEGHEEAAFFYCMKGERLTPAEVKRFGLVKAVVRPLDKAMRPPENKVL